MLRDSTVVTCKGSSSTMRVALLGPFLDPQCGFSVPEWPVLKSIQRAWDYGTASILMQHDSGALEARMKLDIKLPFMTMVVILER